jgi:RimJ/RimL family protein N-acetyltransferase
MFHLSILSKGPNKESLMIPPILKTGNLVIRAFERKDLEIFAQYRSEELVAKYQSWSIYTYEEAVKLFESMDYSTFGTEENWYQLAIALQDSDKLVGDLAVHFIDHDQVEIGFTIAPAYQGKHVATEAVSCFIKYVFHELKKHRIIATTDTENTASYKLLEKLSFRREGHFIQNIFFKGAWGDEYQYGLLRTEQAIHNKVHT